MKTPQNVVEVVAFSFHLCISFLMIATYIHISVSLNMIGALITLQKANFIRRCSYIVIFVLLITFITLQAMIMSQNNQNQDYILQKGVITTILAVIFIVTLFTFIKSMKTLTFQSEYMMKSLQQERVSVVINCLMFIFGYTVIAITSYTILAANVNNVNNINFLKNLLNVPCYLLPISYMIFTHYKVFKKNARN